MYRLGVGFVRLKATPRRYIGWGVALFLFFGCSWEANTPLFSEPQTLYQTLQEKAFHGECDAQIELGKCLFFGQGMPRDEKEALKWFTLASEQKNPEAISFVGYISYRNNSPCGDLKEAFNLFSKAADMGEINSIFFLGIMNMNGQGVKRDYARAYVWFRLFLERATKENPHFNLASEWLQGITSKLTTKERVDSELEFFEKRRDTPLFKGSSGNSFR